MPPVISVQIVVLLTGFRLQSLSTNSTQECLALGNSSSFTVGNVNVSLTSWCDGQGFQYSQVLQVLYLNDLNSCLESCKEYTETEPWPCSAFNFDNGTVGPLGGYLFELVWNSTGGPSITNETGTSSAALTYHTTNTTMVSNT
jgi:hypothetical protein